MPVVQTVKYGETGGAAVSGGASLTFPVPTTPGSLIVYAVAVFGGDNLNPAGYGWTEDAGPLANGNIPGTSYICSRTSAGEQSFPVANPFEETIRAVMFEVSGASGPADEAVSVGPSNTSQYDVTITPPAGEHFVVGMISIPTSFSQGGSFDEDADYTTYLSVIGSFHPRSHVQARTMTNDGSTAEVIDSSLLSQTLPYSGLGASYPAASTPLPSIPGIAFDVYSITPDGEDTYLATLVNIGDKVIRPELYGWGSGQFTINRYDDQATVDILGDGLNDVRLVRVRIPAVSDDYIFAFWVETGQFTLLDSDEQGAEELTFGGRGIIAYLDRDVMAHQSYLTTPFIGEHPFDKRWRLWAAGTGNKPGQILERVLQETQEAGRPWDALPLLVYDPDWNYTVDSDGNAWSTSDASDEFEARVGETILSVIGRLNGTGDVYITMDPHFNLTAWNAYGRDLTGGAFGTGVVRFVKGINLASKLRRQLVPSRVATHELVGGDGDNFGVAALPDEASRVTRVVYMDAFGSGATALEGIGDADLANRLRQSHAVGIVPALGLDEANGYYFPGPEGTDGHFWVGDTVRVHTGSGDFDFDEVDLVVAAITISETDAVAFESPADQVAGLYVTVELNTSFMDVLSGDGGGSGGGGSSETVIGSPGGGSGGSGSLPAHSHPGTVATADQWKQSVRVRTTGNVDLSTGLENGDTVDGITLATADRVLVPAQSTASQNGIYIVQASGAALRASDFSVGEDVRGGVVRVRQGTLYAETAWYVTNTTVPTVGTDAINFAQWTAGAALSVEEDGDTPVTDVESIIFEGATVTEDAAGIARVVIDTGGGGGAVGAGPMSKRTVIQGTGNKTTSSASKVAIDTTNLPYLTLDLVVGQVVRCTLMAHGYHTSSGPIGFDVEVDRPTSGDTFVAADSEWGIAEIGNSANRRAITIIGYFTATEAGIHGFRPAWITSGSSATLANASSGQDDTVISFEVVKADVAEVAVSATYLGKNAVGATATTATAQRVWMKRVVAPSDGIIVSVDWYGKNNANGVTPSFDAGIWADSGGNPTVLLAHGQHQQLYLEQASNVRDLRWLSAGMGLRVSAGQAYWIGVRANAATFDFYRDASVGADRHYTMGYTSPGLADYGVYTPTTTTDDYSIRALFIGANEVATTFGKAVRTSGNITANSTSWANLDTGLDIVLPASVGDCIEVGASIYVGSEAVSIGFDVVTVVGGSPVTSLSGANGASGFGFSGWASRTGTTDNTGASAIGPALASGDISGGTVTLRLRYRTHIGSNKTVYANSDEPFHWYARNVGPA